MQYSYDVIIAGTGSMGSAACYYLAKRGCRVLGLEQFPQSPHDRGSHAGQSRIIRKAYFEHPDYVPLLLRSYYHLEQLENLSGEKLFYKTGLLYSGPPDHPVMMGVKKAAEEFRIELSQAAQHPAFRGAGTNETLIEPHAGFLVPEKTIEVLQQQARQYGAAIQTKEKIIGWKKEGGEITVTTSGNSYQAKKLVITAGAWASQLVKGLNVPLNVTRQVLVWVQPEKPEMFLPENFPCWVIAANDTAGVWYGFPYLAGNRFPGPAGLKFALHHAADTADPDTVDRATSDEEIRSICEAAGKYFIPAHCRVVATKTCLYTNTPDEHFIIDHLPGYDKDVVIACGFSGHGFKFVPVVGEILADLALEGKTDLPAGFLRLSRFDQGRLD
ncbi:MAG: N-methyl-L-tryptophan oxidase [Chitinophagaceae bacterium]